VEKFSLIGSKLASRLCGCGADSFDCITLLRRFLAVTLEPPLDYRSISYRDDSFLSAERNCCSIRSIFEVTSAPANISTKKSSKYCSLDRTVFFFSLTSVYCVSSSEPSMYLWSVWLTLTPLALTDSPGKENASDRSRNEHCSLSGISSCLNSSPPSATCELFSSS
jgi:hypothetical protein